MINIDCLIQKIKKIITKMLIKKEGLCNFHNDFAKKRKTIEKIHNIKNGTKSGNVFILIL